MDFNAEDLINQEVVDTLSEEDLKRLLEILTKAGY
jgi:uncharacterized protein (DUF1778 family)